MKAHRQTIREWASRGTHHQNQMDCGMTKRMQLRPAELLLLLLLERTGRTLRPAVLPVFQLMLVPVLGVLKSMMCRFRWVDPHCWY